MGYSLTTGTEVKQTCSLVFILHGASQFQGPAGEKRVF